MMEMHVLTRCLLGIAVLALAGCDVTDPYHREGTWRPNGANEANLRAMVASPSDLVRGVSSTEGNGQQAVAALDRYRNDKVRLLPDSGIAKIVPVSGGTQGSQ
jgi:type IV pilus biogenesis protein CpaD/CtpE